MIVHGAPIHEHDCPHCIFLGHRDGVDVYAHTGDHATLIARYGPNEQYASGLSFITNGYAFRTPEQGKPLHWTNIVAAVLTQYVMDNQLLIQK